MSPIPKPELQPHSQRIAIIGLGACLPDAPNVAAFWKNVLAGHVAIGEVPPHRWRQDIYYDPERLHMDRSYSRIGGFIRYDPFDNKRFRLLPRSLPAIDDLQKMALVAVAEALEHAGLAVFAKDTEGRAFARERCAVILGNAMGGEAEDRTSLRVWLLEVLAGMEQSAREAGLSEADAKALSAATLKHYAPLLPKITEDSMPGELSNCITGRIANVFDLQGVNFTCDAACASSMAAMEAGVRGLINKDFDVALVGGADRSMDPPTFVKFSRIGALSPNISAPFDARANGFVMGEGIGILVLKRLEDAQADGDRILSVICGIGASSDGRGKALTAPNPRGQRLAVQRAWQQAGLDMASVGLIEAHGTGTPVGDGVEASVLTELLEESGHTGDAVPLGSVKSMIGHLKSAAGAASLIKTTLALHEQTLPPSANFESLPPQSPLHRGRLRVQTQPGTWSKGPAPRRAGISSFGFGGVNYHIVLEEAPGNDRAVQSSHGSLRQSHSRTPMTATASPESAVAAAASLPAARMDAAQVEAEVVAVFAEHTGYDVAELNRDYELEADLGIDSVKQAEIMALLRGRYNVPDSATVSFSALNTLAKVSAYLAQHAVVAAAPTSGAAAVAGASSADDAGDAVSSAPAKPSVPDGPEVFAFGGASREALLQAAQALVQNGSAEDWAHARAQAHKQPSRMAFVASSREEALEKLAQARKLSPKLLTARGVFVGEGAHGEAAGKLAFLFPGQGSQYLGMLKDLAAIYPVVADTFAEADTLLRPLIDASLRDIAWPKEHDEASELALRQTQICQPAMLTADVALARLLTSFGIAPDIVAGHSLGEYAAAVMAGVLPFADALFAVSARGREMASVKVDDPGRMAMVAADASRVETVLAGIDGYVIAANKNCFTQTVIAGGTDAVGKALAAFAELGIEARGIAVSHAFHSEIVAPAAAPLVRVLNSLDIRAPKLPLSSNVDATYYPSDRAAIVERLARQLASPVRFIEQVQQLHDDGVRLFLEVGPKRAITGFVRNILGTKPHMAIASNHPKKPGIQGILELLAALSAQGVAVAYPNWAQIPPSPAAKATTAYSADAVGANAAVAAADYVPAADSVVISGVSVLRPGTDSTPDWQQDAFAPLLAGDNCITATSTANRQGMLAKKIVRLDKASGRFVTVDAASDVVQLAAHMGPLDMAAWGIEPALAEALDVVGKLSIAAGIDALRDAGLPLVEHMRTTSTGAQLKDRWGLPRAIAERTGVLLASAFPSFEAVVAEMAAAQNQARADGSEYHFDRKWLFRALPMGHAQLAQVVLAQGPSSQINAACASGTQALGMAADWIRAGRCDRVIVVTADDITGDAALPWIGAGFLAAGAASIEADVTRAAAPFAEHRNGMILGSGAAAFVVERASSVAERGMQPIAELLACDFANSAFHGTRLDTDFIGRFLQALVAKVPGAQTQEGRAAFAGELLFLSHETYTPARGGSAVAEVDGLRHVFGAAARALTIANTKGFTGHPMGASFEDVVAIKGLQRQVLPPVANLHTPDPMFADLQFAKGGAVQAQYALRFAAGFGSQVAAAVYRRVARQEARMLDVAQYQAWCVQQGIAADARFEVHQRRLRVAERGGEGIAELGIASLQQAASAQKAAPAAQAPQAASVAPATAAVAKAPTAAVAAAKAPIAASSGQNGQADAASVLVALTELFVEHTGYAAEDLDPNHAIEADLGIDSVKQAEILAVVRQRWGIAADAPLVLSEMQTLQAMAHAIAKAAPPAAAAAPAVAEPAQTTASLRSSQPTANAAAKQTAATTPAATAKASVPAATPAAPSGASNAQVLQELTEIFAADTGYELSDLNPTHALEADLGIDSVKQAELFAQLRERYVLAADADFRLSDLQTLQALADYVCKHRQDTATSQAPEATAGTPATASQKAEAQTTAPAPQAPAMPAAAPLAQDGFSARQVRLHPVPMPTAAAQHAEVLHVIAHTPQLAKAWVAALKQHKRKAVVHAADAPLPDSACVLLLVEADDAAEQALAPAAQLFAFARQAAAANTVPKQLLVVSCAGGFGFGAASPAAWAASALSGALKSLAREWPQCRCLHTDIQLPVDCAKLDLSAACGALLPAWNSDAGKWPYVETVLHLQADAQVRWSTPARLRTPLQHVPAPLAPMSLVVATGGARGVTHALVLALAQRRPLDIVIFARTAGVANQDSPLRGKTDAQARELAKEVLSKSHDRVTPAMVKQWLQQEAGRVQVADNLQQLRDTGSQVRFVTCDVADHASLQRGIAEVQGLNKKVALLLHGAGLEESRLIGDKRAEDFARVTTPKCQAFLQLVDALAPARSVTMGSIAGRFGNGGQVDYAAANELLAAYARCAKAGALNIGWTAWADVGMAVRGSVRQVLEANGVVLLPQSIGCQLGAALIESEATGDVVVAGALGVMEQNERCLPQAFDSIERGDAVVLRRRFCASQDAGLNDHRIDGVPVLPGVLGVEWMVQAASWLQGATPEYLCDVQFAAPVKFFHDKPLNIDVEARLAAEGLHLQVISYFVGPTGRAQRREHFSATAPHKAASPRPQGCEALLQLQAEQQAPLVRDDIYRRYFHGPLFQVLADAPQLADPGSDAQALAAEPQWTAGLTQQQYFSRPWGREAAFQAAGLWEMVEHDRMALPRAIDKLWLSPQVKVGAGERVAMQVRVRAQDAEGASFDIVQRLLDANGNPGAVIDVMLGYRSIVLRPLRDTETFVSAADPAQARMPVQLPLSAVAPLLLPEQAETLAFYLCPQERAHLKTLSVRKRRLDWLAGRLAAKLAVRQSWQPQHKRPSFAELHIAADALGAPQVHLLGAADAQGHAPPQLSLSHSNKVAVAVSNNDAQQLLGIDVQAIERRDASFAKTYFTAAERKAVAKAADADADAAWTIRWALKEATLKALGIGARVDFCDLEASALDGEQGDSWEVRLKGEALKQATSQGARFLRGVAQRSAGQVHALVTLQLGTPAATAADASSAKSRAS